MRRRTGTDRAPLLPAGIALGMGLGGFVDGILFHQLLQTHQMLSAVYPPDTVVNVELNMLWDGLFHAFTWCVTTAGVVLLWRAGARAEASWSGRTILGAALIGWGAFNVVEGLIDHFVLEIHHVVERAGLSAWDVGFVAFGLALIAAGAWMIRSEQAPVRGELAHPR
jgi:uncharacterized membrane protein